MIGSTALLLVGMAAAADLDGDGFDSAVDCDDANAAIHPGAREICDGIDDDCRATTGEDGLVSVGGRNHSTIQNAIEAASSGETIEICAGTWFENLHVGGKQLTLEGVGADRTILDGSDADTVVTAENRADLTVRGVTVQHGFTTGNGGGITALLGSALTIADCVVTENHADGNGGGIAGPERASIWIIDSIVEANDAGEGGGGAYLLNRKSYDTVVEGSQFLGNHSGWSGGGILAWPSFVVGRVLIEDTLIDGNWTETGTGGGIHALTGLTLNGVVVTNNQSDQGAGVSVWVNDDRGQVAADSATEIFGNETYAGGFGGGVSVQGTWHGGYVHDNTAAYGGGIYTLFFDSRIEGAVVESNHATEAGGGIYLTGRVRKLKEVDVLDNTSDGVAGGVYLAADGTWDGYDTQLQGCVLNGNVAATEGGGMVTEFDIDSERSNWGFGSTDNSPDDLVVVDPSTGDETVYDAFHLAESFVCDRETGVCR